MIVATWNIAHGRGLGTSNWRGGGPSTRRRRLHDIAEVLAVADLAVLNEADFFACWSFGVNQARAVAAQAGFSCLLRQCTSRAPGLRFGNAVLSRFPLERPEVVRLPAFRRWERLAGFRKDALACTVMHPETPFRIVAVHFDHRGPSVTVPAAEAVVEYVGKQTLPTLVAGDLNATPHGWPNPRQDSPTALDVLLASGHFADPPFPPSADLLTFPADAPRVKIDWILIPKEWEFAEYRVLPVAASDHRPVVAQISGR